MIRKNTFCFVALTVITTVALPTYIWAAVPGNLLENGSFEVYEKDPSTWSIAGRVDFSLGVGNTDIENNSSGINNPGNKFGEVVRQGKETDDLTHFFGEVIGYHPQKPKGKENSSGHYC